MLSANHPELQFLALLTVVLILGVAAIVHRYFDRPGV